MDPTIYLDHALLTPMPPQVKAVFQSTPIGGVSNSGAPFAQDILSSHRPIHAFAGADSGDAFILTSSGAESIQHVFLGVYAHISRKTGQNHFLTGQVEEAPTILSMAHLEELGCFTERIRVGQDSIASVDQVRECLTPRTALISISAANGLTGVIQPLDAIAALCAERGILLHVEGTHLLGKGYFSFRDSGAHFLSWDGAALGAPPGTGGLLIRKGVEIPSLLFGARHQHGLRAGLICPPLWEAFVTACSLWVEQGDAFCLHTAQLRYQLEEGLSEVACSPFATAARVPHITLLQFPGVVSEMICYWLAHRGIKTNMGGNQFQYLHHILQACGMTGSQCHTGLSFALGWENRQEDIEHVIREIRNGMTQFRMMSGVWA